MFQSSYTTIIEHMRKFSLKDSGWIIDSAIDNTISISKYKPLAGSSYIKLPKELYHPRNGLINIQNTDDNECFKWSLVSYLNPAGHHPAKIKNLIKILQRNLTLKT